MIGVMTATVLLAASLAVMIGAVVTNQIDPTYASALGMPAANAIAFVFALLGMAIAMVARKRNEESIWANRTMWLGIVCAVTLAVLFPLSDAGYFSKVG